MENSFTKDYDHIIGVLEKAKAGIEKVTNPEIEIVVTRLKLDLTKHINFLKVRNGQEPDAQKSEKPQPLTKIMGREVTNEKGEPLGEVKPILQTPKEIEVKELKEKVEDIYSKFALTDADQLMDTLSDIEIRAVAKKAGIPVTDNTPKKIDIEFIKNVQDAIFKQHNSGRLVVDALNQKAEPDPNAPVNPEGTQTGDQPILPEGENTGTATNGDLQLLFELANTSNTAILEAYDETQIKEFAKMAGVEVTDKTKIDSKFITQLKDTIKSLDAGNDK